MKKRYRRASASQYFIIALIVISIGALVFLSNYAMKQMAFSDHFVLPWAAGRLWLLEGVSPYDEAVVDLAEDTIDDSSYLSELPDTEILIEPVINLVFYLPFSLIPYEISRAVWVSLLVIASGFVGFLSLKLSGWKITLVETIVIIVFSIIWLPGINAAIKGRLTPIIILLILLGITWILREQDTKAGFILALTFGSLPTTGLIITLLLVWALSRRRWSILKAYFSGVLFLLAVTLLLLPSWPLSWLRVIFPKYGNWAWIHTPLMDFAEILPGIANYLSIFFHTALAIYLLVLWITLLREKRKVFTWKVLATLVVAYLFHVNANINQLFLLLPALFMVFRYWTERWRLVGRTVSWILLVTIVFASWLFVRPGISFIESLSVDALEIGLPLFVFLGMIWIRWWALNIPRLPFEPR